jgi:hypothetical protein
MRYRGMSMADLRAELRVQADDEYVAIDNALLRELLDRLDADWPTDQDLQWANLRADRTRLALQNVTLLQELQAARDTNMSLDEQLTQLEHEQERWRDLIEARVRRLEEKVKEEEP